tara:strand:+ start:216 stop:497 length:282 start_codon:yes stop_codon:yes gene_type:complete
MTKTQLSTCLSNAEARISYLENKRISLKEDNKWFICKIKDLEKDRGVRDLEQQARACCWIYLNVPNLSGCNYTAIQHRDAHLRNQAKALKDPS